MDAAFRSYAAIGDSFARGIGTWSGKGEGAGPALPSRGAHWREHVLPWIGRRIAGRSSGDGRLPQRATLLPVTVPGRDPGAGTA